jgi:hypothetical protein
MDRAHTLTLWAVYASSLALASFLGYTVAVAQGAQSAVVVVGTLALLVTPLLLRGHQAVTLFCWNSTIGLGVLAGAIPSWLLMSVVACAIILGQRALNRAWPLNLVREMTIPLVVFSAVVGVTMLARGGVGVQWLGSGALAGGRKYLHIFGAVLGYFAISMQCIPRQKAMPYYLLFFLGGLTGFIGPLAGFLGGPFEYLMLIFRPIEGVAMYDDSFRVKGMSFVGNAIFGALLARYGFAGVFHTAQFWRPILLVIGMLLGLLSGYRTLLVLYGGTLVMMFLLEGIHRTRLVLLWVMVLGLGAGALYQATPLLPTPIQRALAVLPLPVNAVVRADAAGTIGWREGLWGALWQDVPRYFWLGKGMTITSREMDWAQTLSRFGGNPWDYSYLTGEHHNGFLSVIIGFGVWGFLTLLWVLLAGWWVLWRNWKNGRPDLLNINAFLLCSYICWLFLFFTYWGTLHWSLRDFTGILGLSVALNHGLASPRQPDARMEDGG